MSATATSTPEASATDEPAEGADIRPEDESDAYSRKATSSHIVRAMTTLPDRAPVIDPLGDESTFSPILLALMSGNVPADSVDRVIDFARAERAYQAELGFNEAMARFREFAPVLMKDKLVTHPAKDSTKAGTAYRHTSLGHGMAEVNPILGRCGLNPSWLLHQEDGGLVRVTSKITHVLGYSESVTLGGMPSGNGMNMNPMQQLKSTISYLERIGMFALLGLASAEDDDDGAGGTILVGQAMHVSTPNGGEDSGTRREGYIDTEQSEILATLLDLIDALEPGARQKAIKHYGNKPGVLVCAANPLGLEVPLEAYEPIHARLKERAKSSKNRKDAAVRKALDEGAEESAVTA